MRLAGIDIGSNAVRLLIADIEGDQEGKITFFKKIKLYRVPVRLGLDAFIDKRISESRLHQLIQTMKAYQLLMEVYGVEAVQACATSALREAGNSKEVIHKVRQVAGLDINIIDGKIEADLILSNSLDIQQAFDSRFSHLYVDVGGGSTEISLLSGEGVAKSRSFKIGTIRLFKDRVKPKRWKEMGEWLDAEITPQKPLNIIGSGGNIYRVFKRSRNDPFQPLMYESIKKERDLLSALSIEDRVKLQDMNQDRAEVIVPALNIFLFIMEQTGIRQVVVPKMGLADGIVRKLFADRS